MGRLSGLPRHSTENSGQFIIATKLPFSKAVVAVDPYRDPNEGPRPFMVRSLLLCVVRFFQELETGAPEELREKTRTRDVKCEPEPSHSHRELSLWREFVKIPPTRPRRYGSVPGRLQGTVLYAPLV
jgi:hypothetical protein